MMRTEFSDITTLAGLEFLMAKLSVAKEAQNKLDFEAIPNTLVENLKPEPVRLMSDAWAAASKDDEVFVPPTRRYVPASGAIGAPKPKSKDADKTSDSDSTSRLLNILHYGTPHSPEQYFSSTVVSPSCTPRSGTLSPASESSDDSEFVVTPDDSLRTTFNFTNFKITDKPGPLGFSIAPARASSIIVAS
ncbi:hypothetical protein EXIGLDRAFT_419286 [Exidia glandulosa HHB12029]|uniref:Uncharacterized protein n=1 Tax=Exidia glandulosa HHB12029 TaxID=1314781 RepID=A0A165PUU3_EXIGL|nr:hypothetical protein EXIGLDRAFT_419286 [Exidia glandulosa HHB12029]